MFSTYIRSFIVRKRIDFKRRCFCSSQIKQKEAYEGDGKTTVNILNNEKELGLMINGYSQVGFRLNNNITVLGSMAIFPRSVLSWNIEDMSEITEESLSLFTILEPKLDILVLGIGDNTKDYSFQKKFFPLAKKFRLTLEILPTEVACSTYNFLIAEGRYVAAALIPPKIIKAEDDDVLRTKLRYQNLYETEWS